MHDLKLLREQPALLREAMARRQKLEHFAPVLDRAEALELERRTFIAAVEERKAAADAVMAEPSVRVDGDQNRPIEKPFFDRTALRDPRPSV